MPFYMRRKKISGKWCYSVVNRKSRRIHSKCSTRKNALAQLRLLRAIVYNKNFKLRPTRRRPPQLHATKKYKVLDYKKR